MWQQQQQQKRGRVQFSAILGQGASRYCEQHKMAKKTEVLEWGFSIHKGFCEKDGRLVFFLFLSFLEAWKTPRGRENNVWKA
jgi:hypothetical protein